MAAIYERGDARLSLKLNTGANPDTGKAMLKTVGMPVVGSATADNIAAVAAALAPLLAYPTVETQVAVTDTLGDDGN